MSSLRSKVRTFNYPLEYTSVQKKYARTRGVQSSRKFALRFFGWKETQGDVFLFVTPS